jgi:AraC family transcriptional regulator
MEDVSAENSPSMLKASWMGITVEYSRLPPGEFDVSLGPNLVGVAFSAQDRVSWRVDGGSSRTTPLPPGSVFLYSSREFVWSRWEQPTECLHMALSPDLLNRVAADSCLSSNIELDYRVMFSDPTILHIGHLLKNEIHSGGLAGSLYTESLANILAVHLLRKYSGLEKSHLNDGSLDTFKLNQIKEFIESQLAEGPTLADMAAVVQMSPFHFARAFKSATGQPPHRYLTTRRMERAKILLAVTRLPVAEVAHRVGFANQSHFTAQFRKATGFSPKGYRDSL